MQLSRIARRSILAWPAVLAAGRPPVDREWFRARLLEDLERYRTAVPTASGFLRPRLDRQWRPHAEQHATVVSQTRLLFVQATGWRMTRNAEYRDNAARAAGFLLRHFRDPVYGGFYRRVSAQGAVQDNTKDSYSHAFAIFGLVHAWRATEDGRYLTAARETWECVKRNLRDGEVFLKPAASRDFRTAKGTPTQNPMMHLFEALLELSSAARSAEVRKEAGQLASAIFERLFDRGRGFLPELYTPGWTPLPIERGGRVEVGHQFEWAYLLSEAVEAGLPRRWLDTGQRLLDYGMRHGVDPATGGIFSLVDYGGAVIKPRHGWWEQCEYLRALMRFAARHGRSDLWPAFGRGLDYVKAAFLDPAYGGWFQHPAERRESTDKGTEWFAGYHVTNLYLEALRLTGGVG
jgi:mannose-6-phosphate isomerase